MKSPKMTGLIVGAGLLAMVGMVTPVIQAETVLLPTQGYPTFIKFLGGTIDEIDHAALKLTIQNEMGKKESFPVTSAEVMQGLMKGDSVSVEVDDQGKVLNIVKNNSLPKQAPEPRG